MDEFGCKVFLVLYDYDGEDCVMLFGDYFEQSYEDQYYMMQDVFLLFKYVLYQVGVCGLSLIFSVFGYIEGGSEVQQFCLFMISDVFLFFDKVEYVCGSCFMYLMDFVFSNMWS